MTEFQIIIALAVVSIIIISILSILLWITNEENDLLHELLEKERTEYANAYQKQEDEYINSYNNLNQFHNSLKSNYDYSLLSIKELNKQLLDSEKELQLTKVSLKNINRLYKDCLEENASKTKKPSKSKNE